MKTALISGASRGIGLAIAEALSADGYTLFLNGRHPETLEPVCQRLGAHPVCCDAGIYADAAAAFDRDVWPYTDHIDLLVNNAGISYVGLLQEMDPAEWDRVISTNLNLSDFADVYSERIFSRISSSFILLGFYGDDIRILRKLRK